MHKDHKLKRAERMDIMKRELRQPKTVDRRALEKFKAVPYQLRYKEMIGGKEDEIKRD